MRNLINILEADLDKTVTEPVVPTAPAPNIKEPDYATQNDYKQVIPVIFDALAKTGALGSPKLKSSGDYIDLMNKTVKYKKESGRLPLIRTDGINTDQLLKAAAHLGLKELPLTPEQEVSSGQFSIHSFETPNKVVLTIVLAGRKKGATTNLVLNRKDLTPTKLGLAGSYTDRTQLASAVKKAVKDKVKDANMTTALIELVELAEKRGTGQLTPASLEHVKPVLGMISQDFGEILAPIALAQDSEDISFPVGNEKLIDVTVGGKTRYSVKALGGSGTSMNSLGTLLTDYEKTLTDKGKKELFNNGVKIWASTKKEGSVTDRICLAASKNQIPEYLSYVDILGGEFNSWAELKKLLTTATKGLDYKGFLEMILPATQAGHWGSNVGMPSDSNYYMGLTDKKPKPGVAGKYSYDNNPVDGAANIIAYSLGIGMKNMITRGPNQQQYKDIMNDMVKQMNCQLGHVNIDNQGQLVVTSKPFGNLDFDFDYHAPSHIAGNNRPGFMIVPPNKGDKGKKKTETAPYGSDKEEADSAASTIAAPSVVTGKRTELRPKGAAKIREPRLEPKAGLGREKR